MAEAGHNCHFSFLTVLTLKDGGDLLSHFALGFLTLLSTCASHFLILHYS